MELTNLYAAVATARALGHPARLRTIAMVRSGELCVCQITEVLKLASSTVSLHLKELKRSGLITEHKDGRWVYIALSEITDARSWIETALAAVAGDPQIEADDRMVAELRKLPVEDLCRLGREGAKAKQNRNRSRNRRIGRLHGSRRDTTSRRKR
jgi:ArsR family transcriptional regulator, arsenate/arsenite/antimonite-responsive transcriptional repressor